MSKNRNPKRRRDSMAAGPRTSASNTSAQTPSSSSSSISSTVIVDAMSDKLISFFECPGCGGYVLPPILQCCSGHLICGSCRSKLSRCPKCRKPLDNIPNLAMEKVAAHVKFPCEHSGFGCNVSLFYTEMTKHEEACQYKPLLCPSPGTSCKWQGLLSEVKQHLIDSHESVTELHGKDIVFRAAYIDSPGTVDWVMIQSCFERHFMLVLEKQEMNGFQQFFGTVQLIGSREEADNFMFRLQLRKNERQLAWQGVPSSIKESVDAVIQNSDCLSFHLSTAKLFEVNGGLNIDVTIYKIMYST